jgi:subtilisin family serine protease
MASPYVAEAAALIWSTSPNLTTIQLRQLLRDTALLLGKSSQYGYGLIQVKSSLNKGTTTSPSEPVLTSNPCNGKNDNKRYIITGCLRK